MLARVEVVGGQVTRVVVLDHVAAQLGERAREHEAAFVPVFRFGVRSDRGVQTNHRPVALFAPDTSPARRIQGTFEPPEAAL